MMPPASDAVTVSVTVSTDRRRLSRFLRKRRTCGGGLALSFASGQGTGEIMVRAAAGAIRGRVLVRAGRKCSPRARLRFGSLRSGSDLNAGRELCSGGEHEVEVVFEAVPTGTRVTVRHSGWAALRADHPVRHGRRWEFIRAQGLVVGELMTSFREFARKCRLKTTP